jgi:hypothetical protein
MGFMAVRRWRWISLANYPAAHHARRLLRGASASAINSAVEPSFIPGVLLMKILVKLAGAAALVLGVLLPAQAGALSPADAKALHDYTLSMDKVKAMQAAQDDIGKDPSLKNQSLNGAQSIAQMEAMIGGNPRLVAIYTRHGLSAADVVLMPFVLMSAGTAAQYPTAAAKLSDRTSPAQIAFFKTHETELKATKWLYGSGQ